MRRHWWSAMPIYWLTFLCCFYRLILAVIGHIVQKQYLTALHTLRCSTYVVKKDLLNDAQRLLIRYHVRSLFWMRRMAKWIASPWLKMWWRIEGCFLFLRTRKKFTGIDCWLIVLRNVRDIIYRQWCNIVLPTEFYWQTLYNSRLRMTNIVSKRRLCCLAGPDLTDWIASSGGI